MTPPRWVRTKSNSRVFVRHAKGCQQYEGKRCNCDPSYRGEVWNRDTKRTDKQAPAVKTFDEASGWVTDRRRGIENPEPAAPVNPTGMTNDKFMAMFFAAMRNGDARAGKRRRYADRTADLYEGDWQTHWSPHVGTDKVDAMDAVAWQRALQLVRATGQRNNKRQPTGKTFSDHTLGCKLSCVRAAYRWAAHSSRKLVASNVTKDLDVPAGDRKRRKRVVAPEDVPAMLAAIGDLPTRVFWSFAFYAGMRRAEILALDWSDVAGGEIVVPESKTHNGRERVIPIVPALAAILTEYRRKLGAAGFIGPILPGVRALRLSDQTIYDRTSKAWKAAGLPIYTPHEARHTFASTVIANRDVSLSDLQEWLGHASLEETAGYVQTLPGWRKETAATRLAASFG